MSFLKKNKRRLIGLGLVIFLVSLLLFALLAALAGPKESSLQVFTTSSPPTLVETARFKVMTLNLAHGRLDGAHQILLDDHEFHDNLEAVAEVVRRENPLLLGLQEADDASWWSGGKNHVALLAEKVAPVNFVQGHHIEGLGLNYGTAILSRYPLDKARSYRFGYSPPSLFKGFVICEVTLGPERPLWFVSVHLDFLRAKVRTRQMKRMVEILRTKSGAKVVVGDFNCEWEKGGDLEDFAKSLSLKAYKPEAPGFSTFPAFEKRIDWILVSEEIEFESYKALDDPISDHMAVVAVLRDKRKP